jgi:cellulose synthase operon protein C
MKVWVLISLGLSLLSFGATPEKMDKPNERLVEFARRLRIKKISRWQYTPDSNEDLSKEKRLILNEKRRGLMVDLIRVLRETKREATRLEINLRLGRLYIEDYYAQVELSYTLAKDLDAKSVKDLGVKAGISLDRARSLYQYLIQYQTKSDRRDEMYYFFAVASLDKNLNKEAMDAFTILTSQYPNSQYSSDALAQLGDYYFELRQYPKAEAYYDRIIDKNYQFLSPYAYYKKAWCAYNTSRTEKSLDYFKWVIQNEKQPAAGSYSMRIRQEAFQDIVLPFTDLKMVNKSIRFFHGYDATIYRTGLETMASLYYERGEYNLAITLWDNLIDYDNHFVKNTEYEANIIDAFMMKNDPESAMARLTSALPVYRDKYRNDRRTADDGRKGPMDAFEQVLRKYSLRFHETAQKTSNPEYYRLAKLWYQRYLEFFPTTPDSPTLRHHYASLLFREGNYVDAAKNYYQVFQEAKTKELQLEGLSQTLAAWDRQLNVDRKREGLAEISFLSGTKLSESKTSQKIPYSSHEASFMQVADEYNKQFPQSKDYPDVVYEQSYLRYIHYDFDKAYPGFSEVVSRFSDHPTAPSAVYLMIDILSRKNDYTGLITLCQNLLKHPQGPTLKSDIEDTLRRSELKRIQEVENKGNLELAGDEYVRYSKQYGYQDESLNEKALFNASVNYGKVNKVLKSVEMLETLMRIAPATPLRDKILLQAAKGHELLGNLTRSAQYYQEFATSYPKDQRAKNAMQVAGTYYWGGGNTALAEKAMLTSLAADPEDKLTEKNLIELYKSTSSISKIIALQDRLRSRKGILLTEWESRTLELAELQVRKHPKIAHRLMEEAHKKAENHENVFRKTPLGVELFSKLSFWAIQEKEGRYYRMGLTSLENKLKLLKELEDDYAHISSLGNEQWGLAAIYRTAMAYRRLATETTQAPIPAKLSGPAREKYYAELKKSLIDPFNRKALALAAHCLDQSTQLHLYSPWTSQCYSMAVEIDPDHYPLVRTFYLPPVQTALILPDQKTSLVETGSSSYLKSPFANPEIYRTFVQDRGIASSSQNSIYLRNQGVEDISSASEVIPVPLDYQMVQDDRQRQLEKAVKSQAPDPKEMPTFAYLNLLRLTAPNEAIMVIKDTLKKDPMNPALTNLLALSYLESRNLPAAEVTWLSMISRGIKRPEISNNLGVLAILKGDERLAVNYFAEANQTETVKESRENLGFLALKYHNGVEAKKQFDSALKVQPDGATAEVGELVAQLQTQETGSLHAQLMDLTKRYSNDPFARLSASYFLLDVEGESVTAENLLQDYIKERASGEGMQPFERALQEARRAQSDATISQP